MLQDTRCRANTLATNFGRTRPQVVCINKLRDVGLSKVIESIRLSRKIKYMKPSALHNVY